MSLTPDTVLAYCNHDKVFEEKPVEEINIGRRLLIKPGEKVALDGEVVKGVGFMNQAPITGESMPVEKNVGDTVFAGSINGNSAIEIITTKTSEDSSVAKIIQAVEHAQSKRSASEKWVDKFARIYTPVMIVLAIVIAIVPPLLLGKDWYAWIYEALVILVIACPCALVISTPISIVSSLACAARNGILIKGGTFIEIPARLKAIAFDKTGTLTEGSPTVRKIVAYQGYTDEFLLQIAASLESSVDHPIATAIINYTTDDGINLLEPESVQIIAGKGVIGNINSTEYWLGSHAYAHIQDVCYENSNHTQAQELEDLGYTIIFVGSNKNVIGVIAIQDAMKSNIAEALVSLKELDVEQTIMLTGDNNGTAKAIANQTRIDQYFAELLPEDNVTKIKELVDKYECVAMVGDGINDAPALASSNLGIAMGAIGNDIA
ncbi:hypothetical protein EGW08_023721 [Elysia chlorotica]|uniref:P-type ATPase A domain-containing protein n=1 Tax=Elysia chlorotica TaxID=188477 RepID=A0A3S0Z773_ELYCH|nr:hypothetical protein EGW08_023721 [Elysia chlorotica]